jgi:hypothetical protein
MYRGSPLETLEEGLRQGLAVRPPGGSVRLPGR